MTDHLVLIHKLVDASQTWRVRCSCGFDRLFHSVDESCAAADDHSDATAPSEAERWVGLAQRCAALRSTLELMGGR